MGLVSIVFMIHIFCNVAVRASSSDKFAASPFLNNMLFRVENSAVSFATIPTLILMGYYLLGAAWKGNVKMGMRFLVVTFYPIKWKDTFADAFFVNCIVLNLYAMAVTQFLCECFAQYLEGTAAYQIYLMQIKHMKTLGWFFESRFFVYCLIVVWFCAFVYLLLRPYEKMGVLKLAQKGKKQK